MMGWSFESSIAALTSRLCGGSGNHVSSAMALKGGIYEFEVKLVRTGGGDEVEDVDETDDVVRMFSICGTVPTLIMGEEDVEFGFD